MNYQKRFLFLVDSNLIQSTDDLLSYMKQPRTKIQLIKRSQSSFSVLSSNHRDGKSSYPIIKIAEKNDSIGFDFGTILKVKEASQEASPSPPLNERNGDKMSCAKMTGAGGQTEETKLIMKSREESLEEIRGILKDQLSGSCSVRKIHFSLCQSQYHSEQLSVPGIKRKLRSPPPFIPELLTPFNEGKTTRLHYNTSHITQPGSRGLTNLAHFYSGIF